MRLVSLTCPVGIALFSALALGQGAPPPPPVDAATTHIEIPANPPGHYDVNITRMETLLADPAAKAVLEKYIAQLVDSDSVEQASSMSLKDIQQALQVYAPDVVNDEKLL